MSLCGIGALLCCRKKRDDLCLDRMCVLGLVRAQASRKRTLVCRVTHQDNDRKGFHVLPLCKFPKSIHESLPVFFGRRHSKISRPVVPGISQSFGVGRAQAAFALWHSGEVGRDFEERGRGREGEPEEGQRKRRRRRRVGAFQRNGPIHHVYRSGREGGRKKRRRSPAARCSFRSIALLAPIGNGGAVRGAPAAAASAVDAP